LATFVLALVPRLVQLDSFITTDEPLWVCRSINFRNALLAGDWADTFQVGHPGVITMWIGSAVMAVHHVAPDSKLAMGCRTLSGNELMDFQARPEIYQMRDLLYTARRLMAVLLALAIAAMTLLTTYLFGWPVALLAGVFLAFDPFLIAHSRVFHLDGLTTSLMTLSLLCLLRHWRDPDLLVAARTPRQVSGSRFGGWQWQYLVLGGVLAGLAILNKTPALFLAPFLGVILGATCLSRFGFNRVAMVRFLRDGLTVAVAAGVVGIGLWPALWVDPAGAIGRILGQAVDFAVAGHELPNYFLGSPVNDPGPLFYPLALLFRTSPLVWLGLIGAVVALIRRPNPGVDCWTLSILLIFALVFIGFMTAGAKKFDRYVLEVFPALDIAAAAGLVRVIRQALSLPSQRWIGISGVAGLVSLIAVQVAFVLSYSPYFLSYYNPLLGGPPAARRTLLVGWGEGLDQAAAFLNRQPESSNLRVATWYIDTFAPLFQGYAAKLEGAWRDLSEVDYVLLYVNDLQRGISQPAIERFYGQQPPDHVVNIHGIDYVYIYRNPLRQIKTPQHPLRVELADGLRLLGYDLELEENQEISDQEISDQGPDSPIPDSLIPRPSTFNLRVTLYWQCERRTDISYTVFIHLLDENGQLCGQHDSLPLNGKLPTRKWFPGQTVVDSHEIRIDPRTSSGPYSLALGMYELKSLQRLAAYDVDGRRLPDDCIVIEEIILRRDP
jgi:4-amino-4-deoxy-L-arabinose transferase-like glycosyltransferase